MLTARLQQEVGDPLYFPFELGNRRPIRPMQGYLFKLPRDFLELFMSPAGFSNVITGSAVPTTQFGAEYRPADELMTPKNRDPFAVDPALVERGIQGHAVTQNRLAGHLRSLMIEPRSPRADEPNFDIAWQGGNWTYVAEVKSITLANEEKQLRLGLGQVLRYAHQLGRGSTVQPVLIVERCPSDASWDALCTQFGVILAWPEVFTQRVVPPHQS